MPTAPLALLRASYLALAFTIVALGAQFAGSHSPAASKLMVEVLPH